MATHLSLYVHAATSGRHFIGATIFPTNGVIGTNQISGVPNAAVVTETFLGSANLQIQHSFPLSYLQGS